VTELRITALLFGVELQIDALAWMFGLFTVPIWLLAGVAIRGSLDEKHERRRLGLFYVLAMIGNLGMLIAADLVSLYLCFALLSFASYGLVVHERSARAQRAGLAFMAFTVFGELLLFAGLVLASAVADDLSLASARDGIARSEHATLIAAMLFGGFGVKAGALLLHMWMPLAYAAAPIPAATVLAGVLVKAGLLGWLRTLPLGLVALPSLAAVIMAAGMGAAFYGVIIGLMQRDAKVILAYSSISQMGLMTLAVGVALAEPRGALLRGHVAGRADDGPGLGQRFLSVGSATFELGDAEVADLESLLPLLARRHDAVGRLDVAVDDALAVRGLERGGDLERERADPRPVERTFVADDLGEVAAAEQLHDEVRRAIVGDPGVDDPHDVLMIDVGGGLGLATEALDHVGVCRVLGAQDLDCDGAIERQLPGLVDHAHAADADPSDDRVATQHAAGLELRGHGPSSCSISSSNALQPSRSSS
jgi:hypothetical protein